MNDDVARVHQIEKDLEEDARKLHEETVAFVRQTSQWLDMYRLLNKSMNNLGELETWTRRAYAEIKTVHSSLEYVVERANHMPSKSSLTKKIP